MEVKRTKHDGGVSLPEDIIFDVLARLSAKPLCRFRCACKVWRALISDPAFIAAQRRRAGPHLVSVFYGAWPPEVRVMDMDGNVVRALEMTRSTPLPTWLDLIYVDGKRLSRRGGNMIIDPVAGHAFTVFSVSDPPPPPPDFTYSTSLGRAAPSGTFKVVRIQEPFLWNDDDGGGHQLCEVATVIDGVGTELPTWRRRSAPPFVTASGCDHKAIVNGVLYCMSRKIEIYGNVNGDGDTALIWNRIAAFDLESEEWKTEPINGPTLRHHMAGEIWCTAVVEIKGTLAMVHVHVNNGHDVNIWLLGDPDKSVWVKECRIQLPENHSWPTKLLGILGDRRILLLVRRLEKETRENKTSYHCRDALLFFNPSTKAFTDLWKWQLDLGMHWSFYTGSLLS